MDNSQIRTILVPLDGSALAESELQPAARLAKKIGGTVTLFHVIEKEAPGKVHGQTHLTKPDEAEKYLASVASRQVLEGVPVVEHVHETGVRDVSQSISDHSEELHADLIVMCTHGSTGLRNLLVGTIAQQVISLSKTPVMLVNPSLKKSSVSPNFENFLIPLDGNPDHEHALSYASNLARVCGAKMHLLIAVPRFGNMSGELTIVNRYLPGTTSRMMDMLVPEAKEYLKKLQEKIEASGLNVSTSISRSTPAKAISKTAKSVKSDLIILATHGKTGSKPFWEGSITPKVIRLAKVPILLVPVRE